MPQQRRQNKDVAFLDCPCSRNFSDLDILLSQLVVPSACVLDGEVVVWNKAALRLEPFGGVVSVAKAIREGAPPDAQVGCFAMLPL